VVTITNKDMLAATEKIEANKFTEMLNEQPAIAKELALMGMFRHSFFVGFCAAYFAIESAQKREEIAELEKLHEKA